MSSSIKYLVEVVFLFFIINLNGMSWYNDDWSTYGVNLLARTGEFGNYFVAQSAIKYGAPQMVMDYLIIALIKMGMSYANVTLMLYMVSCILLITGIMALTHSICADKYFSLSLCMIFFICYNTIGNGVSANLMWVNSLYHLFFAFSFIAWAFFFLLDGRRYLEAYLICSIASLFQIQVGFYFGLSIFLFQLIEAVVNNKRLALFPGTFGWLVPHILLFMSFQKGSSILNDEAFVEIYARLRHPHHMIPSSWSVWGYLAFFLWVAISLLFTLLLLREKELKTMRLWLVCLFINTVLAIFTNYFFTDIIPWSLIPKLQPARMVNVYVFCSLIPMIYILAKCKSRGWLFPQIIFAIVGYSLNSNNMQNIFEKLLFLLQYSLIITAFMILLAGLWIACINHKKIMGVFSHHLAYRTWVKYTDVVLSVLCVSLICLTFVPLQWPFSKQLTIVIIVLIATHGRKKYVLMPIVSISLCYMIFIAMANPNYFSLMVNNDLFILGQRTQQTTDKNIIYYADPMSGPSAFSLFSLRTPVVLNKNVPIHDDAIVKWLNLLMEIGAVEKRDNHYVYTNYVATPLDSINFASKHSAEFILITANQLESYLQTGKTKLFDEQGDYILLKIDNPSL